MASKLALLTLVDIFICERNELVEDDNFSLNNRDSQRFSNILDKLGYLTIPSQADRILYDATRRSIERFGPSASKAIIDHLCSVDGLSEEELLTNFDLLEKSLQRVLRKGAEIVLHDIKTEILTHAVLIDPTITISEIRNPQLTIRNILKRIRSTEALEFIRDKATHKHIAFLYKNESAKNKIFSAFFDTNITDKASKGLLLSKKPNNGLDQVLSYVNSSMLYEELLQDSREEKIVVKKLADWVHSLKNLRLNNFKNDATRIASEDVTWWVRNGFADHYCKGFEESMGRSLQDDLSVLCGYNISDYSNNGTINRMIATHGYVILDETSILYRAPGAGY
jgi:predicted transcriptional regulator YheO